MNILGRSELLIVIEWLADCYLILLTVIYVTNHRATVLLINNWTFLVFKI